MGPALFLDAARYVARSLASEEAGDLPDAEEEGGPQAEAEGSGEATAETASPTTSDNVDELIAEGYLVTVGRFLANLDPAVFAELRTNSGDALAEDQWEWIAEGLKALSL